MNKAIEYVGEVREELQKVIWPKRIDAVKLTATVVIITLIVGAFVGILDYIFAQLISNII